MNFKGVGDFFLTQRGRQLCFGLTCVAGLGVCTIKYLPNTFFLDQYRDVVRLYK